SSVAFQNLPREVDRQTARQQTNAVEDRRFQHFAWSWPGEALPHIEQIGHNEDREDGGLSEDETRHAYLPAIWEFPSFRYLRQQCRHRAHWSITLFIAAVRVLWMLQVPQWSTAGDSGDRRKVVSRRRRTYGPFKSPGIPGIVSRLGPFEVGENQIRDKH